MSTTHDHRPLAERVRPETLEDLVGQDHLLKTGSPLHLLVSDNPSATSVLLWAKPSTGKTTLARIIANTTKKRFEELSATSAGIKQVREAISRAEEALAEQPPRGTVLFLDEIHRFAKNQQDSLLYAVEHGTISLIGATTENPSFSVNSALASRAILLKLESLDESDVIAIIDRALTHPRGLDSTVTIDDEAKSQLAHLVGGDARQALTVLELAAGIATAQDRTEIELDDISAVLPTAMLRYDKTGDQHYDMTSAMIKAMRGSDPDAALHWMARALASGEDPRYIARRLVIHASEDVGLADSSVISVAMAAHYAVEHIGLPEAAINLAHAAIAISVAPKSPGVIAGLRAAEADVARGRIGDVPVHLRDNHYPGAKDLGHGAGYLYPHDHPFGIVAQSYNPEGIDGPLEYYKPTGNGHEAAIARLLDSIRKMSSS